MVVIRGAIMGFGYCSMGYEFTDVANNGGLCCHYVGEIW